MENVIGNGWTVVVDSAAHEAALSCARGSYQRGLLNGYESLSGSTLRGTAKSYGYHYEQSRRNLLRRVRAAGVVVSEATGPHNRRLLVLGAAAQPVAA